MIGADKAETGLAVADVAVARTQVAVHTIIRFRFPPEGFVEVVGSGLEDLERSHSRESLRLVYA